MSLHLAATLHLTANDARRKVNGQVVPKLGTGLLAREPELVISGECILWRVPLHLSLPELGDLGQVGAVDVDARTGELLFEPELEQRILQHAERLYAGATRPTE